ncbi:MAG: nucleotide exchange factor GrpE [Chitinophagaceae bacterium]|nr:nucleotide exchange factor GrpE [Chitinophagaceae bacterium]
MSKKENRHHEEELNEEAHAVAENQAVENDEEGTEKTLSEAYEALQKEMGEQKDKYVRLFAEFDNYRKRTAKEILEIRQTASKDVILSLLEVLDDIDRAESQKGQDESENLLPEGVQLIFNKFRRILEQRGLKVIETLHTEFDVDTEEALAHVPVENDNLKGKVIEEIQKGYMLNDKLIRFAKVVVGK